MARQGETIENPITGERMTFLTTAQETGGEFAKIKDEIPAGSACLRCP